MVGSSDPDGQPIRRSARLRNTPNSTAGGADGWRLVPPNLRNSSRRRGRGRGGASTPASASLTTRRSTAERRQQSSAAARNRRRLSRQRRGASRTPNSPSSRSAPESSASKRRRGRQTNDEGTTTATTADRRLGNKRRDSDEGADADEGAPPAPRAKPLRRGGGSSVARTEEGAARRFSYPLADAEPLETDLGLVDETDESKDSNPSLGDTGGGWTKEEDVHLYRSFKLMKRSIKSILEKYPPNFAQHRTAAELRARIAHIDEATPAVEDIEDPSQASSREPSSASARVLQLADEDNGEPSAPLSAALLNRSGAAAGAEEEVDVVDGVLISASTKTLAGERGNDDERGDDKDGEEDGELASIDSLSLSSLHSQHVVRHAHDEVPNGQGMLIDEDDGEDEDEDDDEDGLAKPASQEGRRVGEEDEEEAEQLDPEELRHAFDDFDGDEDEDAEEAVATQSLAFLQSSTQPPPAAAVDEAGEGELDTREDEDDDEQADLLDEMQLRRSPAGEADEVDLDGRRVVSGHDEHAPELMDEEEFYRLESQMNAAGNGDKDKDSSSDKTSVEDEQHVSEVGEASPSAVAGSRRGEEQEENSSPLDRSTEQQPQPPSPFVETPGNPNAAASLHRLLSEHGRNHGMPNDEQSRDPDSISHVPGSSALSQQNPAQTPGNPDAHAALAKSVARLPSLPPPSSPPPPRRRRSTSPPVAGVGGSRSSPASGSSRRTYEKDTSSYKSPRRDLSRPVRRVCTPPKGRRRKSEAIEADSNDDDANRSRSSSAEPGARPKSKSKRNRSRTSKENRSSNTSSRKKKKNYRDTHSEDSAHNSKQQKRSKKTADKSSTRRSKKSKPTTRSASRSTKGDSAEKRHRKKRRRVEEEEKEDEEKEEEALSSSESGSENERDESDGESVSELPADAAVTTKRPARSSSSRVGVTTDRSKRPNADTGDESDRSARLSGTDFLFEVPGSRSQPEEACAPLSSPSRSLFSSPSAGRRRRVPQDSTGSAARNQGENAENTSATKRRRKAPPRGARDPFAFRGLSPGSPISDSVSFRKSPRQKEASRAATDTPTQTQTISRLITGSPGKSPSMRVTMDLRIEDVDDSMADDAPQNDDRAHEDERKSFRVPPTRRSLDLASYDDSESDPDDEDEVMGPPEPALVLAGTRPPPKSKSSNPSHKSKSLSGSQKSKSSASSLTRARGAAHSAESDSSSDDESPRGKRGKREVRESDLDSDDERKSERSDRAALPKSSSSRAKAVESGNKKSTSSKTRRDRSDSESSSESEEDDDMRDEDFEGEDANEDEDESSDDEDRKKKGKKTGKAAKRKKKRKKDEDSSSESESDSESESEREASKKRKKKSTKSASSKPKKRKRASVDPESDSESESDSDSESSGKRKKKSRRSVSSKPGKAKRNGEQRDRNGEDAKPPMVKRRVMWTPREVEYLRRGVAKYTVKANRKKSTGRYKSMVHWHEMLADPSLRFHESRTKQNLFDKHRQLTKRRGVTVYKKRRKARPFSKEETDELMRLEKVHGWNFPKILAEGSEIFEHRTADALRCHMRHILKQAEKRRLRKLHKQKRRRPGHDDSDNTSDSGSESESESGSEEEAELSDGERARRKLAEKILRELPPMSPGAAGGGGAKTMRPRLRKTFRFKMAKKDENGREEWVWQHVRNARAKDAALKAATRGVKKIQLYEEGTNRVHCFTGSRKKVRISEVNQCKKFDTTKQKSRYVGSVKKVALKYKDNDEDELASSSSSSSDEE